MSPAKKQQKPPHPKAKPKVKMTRKEAAAAQTSPAKAKTVASEARPKKGDKSKPVITKAAEEEAGGDSSDDLEAALSDMLGEEGYGEEENGEEEDMEEPDDEVDPDAPTASICIDASLFGRSVLSSLFSRGSFLRFSFVIRCCCVLTFLVACCLPPPLSFPTHSTVAFPV